MNAISKLIISKDDFFAIVNFIKINLFKYFPKKLAKNAFLQEPLPVL